MVLVGSLAEVERSNAVPLRMRGYFGAVEQNTSAGEEARGAD